jgi:hypothetical protein
MRLNPLFCPFLFVMSIAIEEVEAITGGCGEMLKQGVRAADKH